MFPRKGAKNPGEREKTLSSGGLCCTWASLCRLEKALMQLRKQSQAISGMWQAGLC